MSDVSSDENHNEIDLANIFDQLQKLATSDVSVCVECRNSHCDPEIKLRVGLYE